MNDFLDNLANDQHQKMLREIANDDITPKKRDKFLQNDLYERKNDEFDEENEDPKNKTLNLAWQPIKKTLKADYQKWKKTIF